MADRDYVFHANNSSVTLTTSWGIFQTPNTTTGATTSTGLTSGNASTFFSISGITLGEGESIKKAILSSTRSSGGTVDSSATFTMNGNNYAQIKKVDVSQIVNGTDFTVSFYLRASGKAGTPGHYTAPNFYSMTTTVSDLVLTVTVGTGNSFDGKVSSLNEGDKIILKEANDAEGIYTLVHHEYNTGKALLFRDASIGTKAWRSSAPSSAYSNVYPNSTLDTYLTNTWYPTIPSETSQFLQALDYLTADRNGNATPDYTINRYACTISGVETGLGGSANYGSPLNDTSTLAHSPGNYWTREPVGGMNNYAKSVPSAGASQSNSSVTNNYHVRPTLGVLEDQLVAPSDTEGVYYLASRCTAPSTLYINGAASDVSGLGTDANLTLSWTTGTGGYNSNVAGYAVWYSTSADGEYTLYGTTTSTSMTVIGPGRGFQVYYFKVQTLGPEDADYLNSELSASTRAAATKRSNVYYYDGTKWLLAMPNYYNSGTWKQTEGMKYYNGSTWIIPGT